MNRIRISLMAVLATMLFSTTAFAGSSLEKSSSNEVGAMSAGISIGYLTFSRVFDRDGVAQSETMDGESATIIPITLDLAYGIVDNLDANIQFSLVSRSLGDRSGANMREALIGLGYAVAGVYITGGFKLDLGPKIADLGADEMHTSDNQHGIAFGVHYNHGLSDALSLHLGLGLVMALEAQFEGGTNQNGLLLDPNVGVAYNLGRDMEIGLDLGYYVRQDRKLDGLAQTDSGSNALYVIPWFGMALGDGNFTVALGARTEDIHNGINLMGKGSEQPHPSEVPVASMPLGATIGWATSF